MAEKIVIALGGNALQSGKDLLLQKHSLKLLKKHVSTLLKSAPEDMKWA